MAVLAAGGCEYGLLTSVLHPVSLGTLASVLTSCYTPNLQPPMSTSATVLRFPSILKWNTNGLRTRLPEHRREVSQTYLDVLALQETNVRHLYVDYQTMLPTTARRTI